jgi:hypothetical protein
VLRWRPYHHWDPFRPPPPPQETELIGGVEGFGIAYWDSSGVWVSNWHELGLPLLVRIPITFAGLDPRRWPDVVAAPLLSRP